MQTSIFVICAPQTCPHCSYLVWVIVRDKPLKLLSYRKGQEIIWLSLKMWFLLQLPQWTQEGTPHHSKACNVPQSWLQLLATPWMNDAHSVLSSQPCSALEAQPVASSMESIQLMSGLLFFRCLYVPGIIVFPNEPAFSHVWQLQFVILPQEVSGFICSETHLFAPFAVPGLCRALLHHVNEPVSHQPLPCLALTSARGDWEDEGWTPSALVSVARLCSWWPFLIFHCCPSDLLVSWLLPALEPRVGPRSASALPISVSSLWMLKLCISSAARIYLPVGQMQSCFASFLLHCHQKSLQIIATFCLSGGVTCRA